MSNEVDPQAMRNTMRLWASGVSIVTTAADGQRGGLTVSSFTSLSLQPPMILVCLHKDSHAIPLIERSGVFAVSILNAEQAHISDRFAGRIPLQHDSQRFDGVNTFAAATGSPIIEGAVGWVDCKVALRHDGSTHWIYIGEVVATGSSSERAPLLYYDRGYRSLQPEIIGG